MKRRCKTGDHDFGASRKGIRVCVYCHTPEALISVRRDDLPFLKTKPPTDLKAIR